MPEDKPDLTEEAHRVATEAVNALEAFAHAATSLPADVARLALDVVQAAVDKAKDVVNKAAR
jgi:hypothetical protein